MPGLIHIIYSSTETRVLDRDSLHSILDTARRRNRELEVTGILLHSERSFLQVIEGEESVINDLFNRIRADERHRNITLIIRESIAARSFSDWTMGFAEISHEEGDEVPGLNDFFTSGKSFADLTDGRARKILKAFKEGRWRARLSGAETAGNDNTLSDDARVKNYTFAFQPIVNVQAKTIFSYEALIRGPNREKAEMVLKSLGPEGVRVLDREGGAKAIGLAASLGLQSHLNLNMLPANLEENPAVLKGVLDAARKQGIDPGRIIIEILEREIVHSPKRFTTTIQEFRSCGLKFAIDDFGAGYAGLNLLADFQPDLIKLDMALVKGISGNGPRQAIVRGISRTCFDLGIDLVAEGVETEAEFNWLREEGIELFQGFLLARPAFEKLPREFYLPA